MKSATEIIRTTLGKPTQGCRHCGTVVTKHAANGRVTIYHPGVTCCIPAVKDQIRYRQAEFDLHKNSGAQFITAIEDAERKAKRAVGKEQTELLQEANKIRAAYVHHIARIKLIMDGDGTDENVGLTNELRELRALLDQLTRDQRYR